MYHTNITNDKKKNTSYCQEDVHQLSTEELNELNAEKIHSVATIAGTAVFMRQKNVCVTVCS